MGTAGAQLVIVSRLTIRYFPCKLCEGTRKRGPAFLPWRNIARCNIRCLGLLRRYRVSGRTFSLLRIFRSWRVLLFSGVRKFHGTTSRGRAPNCPDEHGPSKAFDVGAAIWVTFFRRGRPIMRLARTQVAGMACRGPTTAKATAKIAGTIAPYSQEWLCHETGVAWVEAHRQDCLCYQKQALRTLRGLFGAQGVHYVYAGGAGCWQH
jgi:hypothetical protein